MVDAHRGGCQTLQHQRVGFVCFFFFGGGGGLFIF